MTWDMIIIGAGPGGLQAAIAASSEGMKVLVLEAAQVGGQIGQTPLLENSVFSAGGITGPAFAEQMKSQALAMGTKIQKGRAIGLTRVRGQGVQRWRVAYHPPEGGSKQAHAHTVILAVGAKWRELDIDGVKGQLGKSVHFGPVKSIGYNATGRNVAVYGGGPSAGQAILALAEQVNTRRVIVLMRSTLSMPDYLVQRILAAEDAGRVLLHENMVIDSVTPLEDGLLGIQAGDFDYQVDALFMCNGLIPNTAWLKGILSLDEYGQIEVTDSVVTSLPGVYAIGDCRAGSTPRVGVAIGDGSMAVTKAWGFFSENMRCANCARLFGVEPVTA